MSDKPSVSRVRDVLFYSPEDGSFRWRLVINPRVREGGIAGSLNSEGYRLIRIDRGRYRAHHLAWLYTHGVWPSPVVDHINGERDDNRIANLRLASRAENSRNRGALRNSATGLQGASLFRGKYRAVIHVDGKQIYLGAFSDLSTASDVYQKAARQHFGDFRRPS